MAAPRKVFLGNQREGLLLAQNCHSGSRSTHVVIKHRRCGAARPRRRGAWHRGAAPGCCRANRVATPRYPGDQPIDPHSDADAPPNVQHPEDMADRDRRGAARYDLVFVFDRPAGDGSIEKFSLVGQMLLAGDAPTP
jgi:hypothetical protein